MTDYMDLALKYGGFTSLDKVYLAGQLEHMTEAQKLTYLTPPPSVINAYFAELYQKQGPKAATDYYLDLSRAFDLFQNDPSFAEEKPFVRLNLSGKAYGFAYENSSETAQVFAENPEPITPALIFELTQIFPDYKIYQEDGKIKMHPLSFEEEILEDVTPESALLSRVVKLKGDLIKISSFNQEELATLLQKYTGQIYYGFEQRQYLAYITKTI